MGNVLKGTKNSNTKKLASAIFLEAKNNDGESHIRAIGQPAVNQTVKAIAVANSFAELEEMELWTKPIFEMVEDKSGSRLEKITSLRFICALIEKAKV